jgi:hypothetical protein
MKTFYEYLAESNKEYALRIKFATDISEAMLDRMETHLEKYGVKEISKPKKTIAQSNPMDFAESRGREVTIVDFVLDYPVVSDVLRDEICEATGLSRTHVVVRSPNDEPMNEEEAKSKLEDSEYSDAAKIEPEKHYGDVYNSKFTEELAKVRADRKKNIIGETPKGVEDGIGEGNTKSPIGS